MGKLFGKTLVNCGTSWFLNKSNYYLSSYRDSSKSRESVKGHRRLGRKAKRWVLRDDTLVINATCWAILEDIIKDAKFWKRYNFFKRLVTWLFSRQSYGCMANSLINHDLKYEFMKAYNVHFNNIKVALFDFYFSRSFIKLK